MREPFSSRTSVIRALALWLTGAFTGALIFILGVAAGVALAQPGGLLHQTGLPFITSNNIEVSIASDSSPGAVQSRGRVNTALLNEALRKLREQWYGTLPSDDVLTDGALRGMVNALGDPYTQYVEPRFARLLREDISGQFEGIGATLRQIENGGGVQIVRVFPGSPAERGGVLPGDIVEAVDGVNVSNLSTTEVAALIRGPRGTKVKLTLRRSTEPRPVELTLTRELIVIPVVESRMVGDGDIAYVSLFDFSQQASRQLETELRKTLAQQPRGLILDLRDNPGGLLSQAVEVGDIFLDEGVFVIERDYRGNTRTTRTTSKGIAQDIPLVVLVNAGSASASEIVAGAIQDRGRGVLIGERTFGKGSVQSPQTLSNGGQLRITIERWFTPKDRLIHEVGITPDYVVTRTLDDQKANRDPQLDAAVEFITTGAVSVNR